VGRADAVARAASVGGRGWGSRGGSHSSTLSRSLPTPTPTPPHKGEGSARRQTNSTNPPRDASAPELCLSPRTKNRLAPGQQKREAKRRKAHCPTNRRLRGGASLSPPSPACGGGLGRGCARLSALHRGTHHRLLPRWFSPRTGFPEDSSSQVFCPLASSPQLSTLRADRSFCRPTGDPGPPGCGLAIPPAGTAPRSAFQACLPERRPR
jgi:hypothetical protein